MHIDYPAPSQIPALRQLWQLVFGDSDTFLDSFFRTAFSCDRCRCVLDAERIAAVLYWFDCAVEDRKFAYVYAVATHPDYRNRGLCRALMADTHALMADRGYAGVVLVPQEEGLRAMYAKLGYRDAGGLNAMTCCAAKAPVSLRAIGAGEFASLRRQLLPAGSVVQEGENLAFLAEQLQFYAGDGFLLAAYGENRVLHGMELLGDCSAAPGIVSALHCHSGSFRSPGDNVPFAMFHPLAENAPEPSYFGFAFD